MILTIPFCNVSLLFFTLLLSFVNTTAIIDKKRNLEIKLKESLHGLFSESCRPDQIPSLKSKDSSWKITGGKEARKGEFPYMVGIFGITGKLSCGGSLLTNTVVLTAAHCLFTYCEKDILKLKIRIGDHDITSNSEASHETRKIAKVILHKEFNMKTFKNDIALVKLNLPVTFGDTIQPVCLPLNGTNNFTYMKGVQAIATGWGKLSSGTFGISPTTLRKVEIPIWNLSECQKIYNFFAPGRVTISTICAGDGKRNKDACIGDSGGPLVVKSNLITTQIGIISWGKGCGSFPGVYTNVKYYTNWIEQSLVMLLDDS